MRLAAGPAKTAKLPPLDGAREAELHKLTRVRLPSSRCDILLANPTGKDAWRTYINRLVRSDSFRDQTRELETLQKMEALAAAPLCAETPRVGIVCSEPAMLLPGHHANLELIVDSVVAAGCHPILIPPRADLVLPQRRRERAAGIQAMARQLDALISPGGNDVDPKIYGELTTYAVNTSFARDRFEAHVFAAALHQPLYLFAICRSHQLLSGKLVQDVRKEGVAAITLNQKELGLPTDAPMVVKDADGQVLYEHRVHFRGGSELARLIGNAPSAVTNSLRHQAATQAREGLRAVGMLYDPLTGAASVQASEGWNAMTTQFHPEIQQKRDAWAKVVFETPLRRAHIFREVKRMQAEGLPLEAAPLCARLARRLGEKLLPEDYAWVREKLVPQLRKMG